MKEPIWHLCSGLFWFVCVWVHVRMRNAVVRVCLNMRMRSWVDWMDMSTELGFHNSSVTVYKRKHELRPDSSIDSCVIRRCVKVLCYNCIYISVCKFHITTHKAKPTGIRVSIKCILPFWCCFDRDFHTLAPMKHANYSCMHYIM